MARKAAKVAGVYEKYEGSGVWYVRYKIKGKPVRKAVGTRQQAIDYLDKVKYLRSTGEGIVPSTAKKPVKSFEEIEKQGGLVTVADLCDDWLTYVRANPSDYKDQRNPPIRIAIIKAHFGERPAGSVRPYEIDDWLDAMGGANATKNKYKFNISAVYRYGQSRDKIAVNPASAVRARKTGGGLVRYLLPEEEMRIRAILQADINACPETQPTIRKRLLHRVHELDVSLGTGMRKSEQYDLLWPDVDFTRRSITVRDTKNGETRVVPMIDDVRDALLAIQALGLSRKDRAADQPNMAPDDSVFFVGDNHKWWGNVLKRAKVKNYRWHDNRHTFCSRLAQSGASMKIIQEAAGHKTIQMSARYAHLHQTHLAEAMAVLNRSHHG